jgi:hypothetical protein
MRPVYYMQRKLIGFLLSPFPEHSILWTFAGMPTHLQKNTKFVTIKSPLDSWPKVGRHSCKWPKHVAQNQGFNNLIDFINIEAYNLITGSLELFSFIDKFT